MRAAGAHANGMLMGPDGGHSHWNLSRGLPVIPVRCYLVAWCFRVLALTLSNPKAKTEYNICLRGAYDYIVFKVVVTWVSFGPIYFQSTKTTGRFFFSGSIQFFLQFDQSLLSFKPYHKSRSKYTDHTHSTFVPCMNYSWPHRESMWDVPDFWSAVLVLAQKLLFNLLTRSVTQESIKGNFRSANALTVDYIGVSNCTMYIHVFNKELLLAMSYA